MKRIPVYKRTALFGWALVDDEDYPILVQSLWRATGAGYVCRYPDGNRLGTLMHRELTGCVPGDGLEVDHQDGNPFNNQRSNLRLATRSEQIQNTRKRAGTSSPFRGVTFVRGRWRAQAKLSGKTIYLGSFDNEAEAAVAARAYRDQHYTHAREEEHVASS